MRGIVNPTNGGSTPPLGASVLRDDSFDIGGHIYLTQCERDPMIANAH